MEYSQLRPSGPPLLAPAPRGHYRYYVQIIAPKICLKGFLSCVKRIFNIFQNFCLSYFFCLNPKFALTLYNYNIDTHKAFLYFQYLKSGFLNPGEPGIGLRASGLNWGSIRKLQTPQPCLQVLYFPYRTFENDNYILDTITYSGSLFPQTVTFYFIPSPIQVVYFRKL